MSVAVMGDLFDDQFSDRFGDRESHLRDNVHQCLRLLDVATSIFSYLTHLWRLLQKK
jgi:hypothetical protein